MMNMFASAFFSRELVSSVFRLCQVSRSEELRGFKVDSRRAFLKE